MGDKLKRKTYGKKVRAVDCLSEEFGALSLDNEQSERQPLGKTTTNIPPLQQRPQTRAPGKQRVPASERPTVRQHQPKKPALESLGEDLREYLSPLTEVIGEAEGFAKYERTVLSQFIVSKIGDGSYADVFKVLPRPQKGVLLKDAITKAWTSAKSEDLVILKLIPIKPPKPAKNKIEWGDMTTVENALSEYRLLNAMTEISGFVEFRKASVLYGALPIRLSSAIERFRKDKNNMAGKDEVRIRENYPDDQCWLMIEMSDAGHDLDTLMTGADPLGLLWTTTTGNPQERRLDIRQARDIFWSTANSLAQGEQQAKFEHRDLHLSNICLKKSHASERDDNYNFVPESSNIETTLIDYTLSRAEAEGIVIHNPMKDRTLFGGQGDLQFDTYRHMRDAAKVGRKAEWEAFVPLTNVLWLHHLLVKVLKRTTQPLGYQAAEALWATFESLRDATDPSKMETECNFLSASDIVVMGKVGEAEFRSGVLQEGEEEEERDGAVMRKAKARRLQRLLQEATEPEEETVAPSAP